MSHEYYDRLETGMGRSEVLEIADFAPQDPTLIPVLIEYSKQSKPKSKPMKASWVLHHIANRHPSLIEPYVFDLMDILDESDNTSVYREILKILCDIKLTDSQFNELKVPLFDLAIELLYDDSMQKGLHYISMRLTQRYGTSLEEKKQAIESISELISRSGVNDKSLCRASKKVLEKIRKSLS